MAWVGGIARRVGTGCEEGWVGRCGGPGIAWWLCNAGLTGCEEGWGWSVFVAPGIAWWHWAAGIGRTVKTGGVGWSAGLGVVLWHWVGGTGCEEGVAAVCLGGLELGWWNKIFC